MTILYQHPRARVFHGDWRELTLPADSVDVTLTDPPYTAHVQANVRSCDTSDAVKVHKYDIPFDPLMEYSHVPDLLRVTRRWVLARTNSLRGDNASVPPENRLRRTVSARLHTCAAGSGASSKPRHSSPATDLRTAVRGGH